MGGLTLLRKTLNDRKQNGEVLYRSSSENLNCEFFAFYEKIIFITKTRKLENTKIVLAFFVFSSFRVLVIDLFWFRPVRVGSL
jgi:preprotein translocase subunit SecE